MRHIWAASRIALLSAALWSLLLLLGSTTASATELPATVTGSTTLTAAGSPYTGSSTVEAGATLSVEPGVELANAALVVKGALVAEGTAEEPIVFKGGSGRVEFEPGSGASVIDHAEMLGVGAGFTPHSPITIRKSSPTISNTLFEKCGSWTIHVPEGGGPQIAGNTFIRNERSAVYFEASSGDSGQIDIYGNYVEAGVTDSAISVRVSGSAVTSKSLGGNAIVENEAIYAPALRYEGPDVPPDISGNLLIANAANYIVAAGTVAQSSAWINSGSVVRASVTIAPEAALAVEPGVLLDQPVLTVKGTLVALGSEEEPVVMTGGGGKVVFEPGSGASVLDHVVFNELGFEYFSHAPVEVVKSSPTISNSTFLHCGMWNVWASDGGAPEIAGDLFVKPERSGIRYQASSGQAGQVNIHDNLIQGGSEPGIWVEASESSSVAGKALSGNVVLENTATYSPALRFSGPEIPGDITENTLIENKNNLLEVGGTVTHTSTWKKGGTPMRLAGLEIESGATLHVEPGVELRNPAMVVNGTLDAKGSAEEPIVFSGGGTGKGEWETIHLEPGSGSSALEHVEVAGGGGGYFGGPEIAVKSSASITNSTIRRSAEYAIDVTGAVSPQIERNRFRENRYGLSYSGPGKLSAPNNDWDCGGGPKPAGCGEEVSSNVDWEPAVQLQETGAHCRGKESQCGEGADPVDLATGRLDYSHRDLLLTNRGDQPLEFTRTYNSGSSADAGLGRGWSQSGLATASELANGDVLVVRSDGRQDLFEATEAGYEPPSGVTDTLEKVEGTFRLTTLEGTVYRFDSSGRIASITDDHGLKTTYAYNSEGRLSTITDPSGQTLSFSYNASNYITAVEDSTGREVRFAYSGAGELQSVTDALGGVTEYAYDSQHRLTQITDPRGDVILENTYDSQGRIVEQRDGLKSLWKLSYGAGETTVTEPEGGKRNYGFDSQNRVVSETDQLGHTTTTAYDAAGNISKVIGPGGAEWAFGHDAAGNLTSVEDPEGGERGYEYDAKNRLTGFTDARGNSWSYEWSAANDLTKVTDPEGGETALTYTASGQPLTATDPDGHETEFSYDARGNELSATDPLGHETSFEYDARNYLVAKALPGLEAETFEPDALGDVLTRTTPEGHETSYEYDANGLPIKVTDPAEDVWRIERDAMERPTAYVDPLEGETQIAYNGDLKPVKVVDRRGAETTYAYDLANQLTEVSRPEGGTWKYGYDARGNRTSALDPRGHETTYAYDLLNRMTEAHEPLSVTTKYAYDSGGDLTKVTDPRGNATSYAYDDLGRLTEIAQPLEATTTYAYDPVGNELSKTTAAGTLEYGYDATNRLTSVEAGEATLRSYGYDAAGRLTEATDAEGHTIEVGYTEEGRPSSIDDGRGQSLTRSYDSRGNLVEQVDGRGTLEYGYDELDRMTSLTDPQGKTLEFTYDPEGDLTEITRPGGITTANAYDEAGRLAETTTGTAEPPMVLESLKYGYDAAGNVTSKFDQRIESETSYSYDALNRLVEFNPPGEGATTYGYDAAGNRTKAGGTSYSFNALNQLTEDSTGTTYSYDGAGRLTGEVNGSEESTFSWDPFDHLAKAEVPGGNVTYAFDGLERLSERKSGESTKVFHYGDLGDVPTYTSDTEGKAINSYVQGPRGLVEQRSEEATAYPLIDGHGDVTAIANGAAEVASRQSFDPWGNQLSGPNLEMGYLGAWERPTDPTSGLIQMGARSYAPSLGSFASEDPVLGHFGVGISGNRYPYAANNPSTRYDLNGRETCFLGACTGEVFESVEELTIELEEGLEKVERGAEQVGSSVGSAAETGWNWTAPSRGWIANRAQEFWKHYGGTLKSVYAFAAEHWQTCREGAKIGAPAGAIYGGAKAGATGALIVGTAGGVLGCAGPVGAELSFGAL